MSFQSEFFLRLLVFFVLPILFFGCSSKCEQHYPDDREQSVVPTTTETPEPVNSFTPKRIVDLHRIVIALEQYKRQEKMYPPSVSSGNEWDILLSETGEVNRNWISGLVPNYLPSLPVNVGENKLYLGQYLYKSNGANYKLIAYRPSDCEFIKSKLPAIIDPRRDCSAYGFWTAGAVTW